MDKQNIDIHFFEKRTHPRFNIHCLADIQLTENTVPATAIDISETGIGLVIPHHFRIGEVIDMKIYFPVSPDEKESLEIKAKVIWVGKENEKKLYSCGLQIMNISEKDLATLRTQLKGLPID